MSAVRGSPGVGFVYATPDGSREHVYALKRARWAAACRNFLRGGRLVMRLEPTPEPWGVEHGFFQAEAAE